MAGSEIYDRSRRAEDDYFRRRDAELMEKAREASRAAAAARVEQAGAGERQLLGDALGVHDAAILGPLHAAGMRASHGVLLEWLPAIDIAWVDDIEMEEREELRRQFAVDPQANASGLALLSEWLFLRPPREALMAARQALRSRLDAMDPTTRQDVVARIVARCEAVGRASGGVLGFWALSWDERARIDGLRESLGDRSVEPMEGPIEIAH
ncbi:MAG: hypothetical protein AB7H96_06640 [Vicinamibacterales bacterium]